MRIAIVQGAFLPVPARRGGAVEKIWFALGQEFARRGHEVTHYSRLCDGLPASDVLGGVRHVRLQGSDTPATLIALKWQDLLYTRRVARRLDRADVVVTNTFWAPLILSPRRHGPVWVHVQRYPKGQMMLYRHAARLQTVSAVIAAAIVRQAPSLRSRIRVIHNPLPSLANLRSPARRDPNLILFVGRIHPEKGLELLLRAAAIAFKNAPQLHYRLVGPSERRFGGGGGDFQRRLDRLAAGLDGRVEFTGPVFDESVLGAHFASASLFIYPSLAARGEASPVAPLEALARGCPVVTSSLECFDDTLGTGPFARRFDHSAPDSAERLAAEFVRLATERETWPAASAAAEVRAAHFSLDRIASEYLAGFESLSPFGEKPARSGA